MDLQYTARDIDTNLKASSKFKKAFTFSDYFNPVYPITASTYKTGKHGHAKTRLLLKDYFTQNVFSLIVDSDAKFTELEKDSRYNLQTGIVAQVNREQGTVKILTMNYEQIEIKQLDPLILNNCTPNTELTYISYTSDKTYYKIKGITS